MENSNIDLSEYAKEFRKGRFLTIFGASVQIIPYLPFMGFAEYLIFNRGAFTANHLTIFKIFTLFYFIIGLTIIGTILTIIGTRKMKRVVVEYKNKKFVDMTRSEYRGAFMELKNYKRKIKNREIKETKVEPQIVDYPDEEQSNPFSKTKF